MIGVQCSSFSLKLVEMCKEREMEWGRYRHREIQGKRNIEKKETLIEI